jgi:site-specific recombinase XerD
MLKQIKRYLVAARQAGKSPATVRQYGWHLEKMAAWLSEQGCNGLGGVTRDALRQWGAELQNVWAPATVKQAVNAARAFFRWCWEERLGEDLGLALKVPTVPQRAQRTITAVEVQKLLVFCDGSAKGVRDRALILLLVDTGLRAREVCRLKVDDLDIKGRMLTVVVKGGQREFVFFGQTTAERLESWLRVRPSANGTATVFVSLGGNTPGRPLTTRGLRSNLKRLGERAGLRGVTTHAFRRGFACIATQAGAPTRTVQLAGRWSDIRMVERYTQDLERQSLYTGGWSPADYLKSA